MYLPSHFAETDRVVLHQLMQQHPLATLVTLTPAGLNADTLPLLLSPDEGRHGILRGHVARANPIWQQTLADTQVLVLFQGPDAYISPSWYPAKQEHGKVVPTWNYVVVQASGFLRIVDDALWLRELLEQLTTRHEASQPQPWSIHDAPPDYIDRMLAAVVGIEIEIGSLTGKWKTSQNQTGPNRAGVIAGLQQAEASAMAALVARKRD